MKEENLSPTFTTEYMFLSCVTNTKENREVATFNAPGEFTRVDMD